MVVYPCDSGNAQAFDFELFLLVFITAVVFIVIAPNCATSYIVLISLTYLISVVQQRLAHFSLSEANSESICFEQGKKINLCWIVWSLWVVLCTHYVTRTESTKGVSLWSFSFIQKKRQMVLQKMIWPPSWRKITRIIFFLFVAVCGDHKYKENVL